MLNSANIIITLMLLDMPTSLIEGVMHPTSTIQEAMTCEEFGQTARFNPYSVIGDIWTTFYYWAPHTPRTEYKFSYPNPRERAFLKQLLSDKHVTVPVNWTARFVVMQDLHTRESMLLVEKGDRGQFWLYHFARGAKEGQKLEPDDIQLKQTSDNKYIAFMECRRETVYVLSRKSEIPPKAKIQDAAACIGYRGRGGKSYLYQGHEWMPISEADEHEYWNREEYSKSLEEDLRRADEGLKWQKKRRAKGIHLREKDREVEKNVLV